MLANNPRLTERQVQEQYQLLHPDAPSDYSKTGKLLWSALRASAVTRDPYTHVSKKDLKNSPPFSPVQLYFKTWALERNAETLFSGQAKLRQPNNLCQKCLLQANQFIA